MIIGPSVSIAGDMTQRILSLTPTPVYENESPAVNTTYNTVGVNASACTIFFEFTESDFTTNVTGSPVMLSVADAGGNNRIFLQKRGTGGNRYRFLFQSNGGTNEIFDNFLSVFPGGKQRLAISWDSDSLRLCHNGMIIARIDSGLDALVSLEDSLHVGRLYNATLPYSNATADKVSVYNKKLSDAQLCALTHNIEILSGVTYDSTKRIIGFVGQSNSSGAAEQDSNPPVYDNISDMYNLGNDMVVKAYLDPYDVSTSSKVPGLDDATAEVGMAGFTLDALQGLTGLDLMSVPANKAGTSFEIVWNTNHTSSVYRTSGTKMYGMGATAIGAIHNLLLARQFASLEAIVFSQGESDAEDAMAEATYETRYSAFIDVCRTALALPNIWWIDTLMPAWNTDISTNESEHTAIINAKNTVIASKTNAVIVDGTLYEIQSSPEREHYSLLGYENLGSAVADAIKENVYPSVMPEGLETFHSTDGTPRTIDMSGEDYLPDGEGFLWAQLTVDAVSGSERYPIIINPGNSSNNFTLFLDNGINFAGYLFRGSSTGNLKGNLSVSGVLRPPYTTRQMVGIAYDNERLTAYVYQNGYMRTQALTNPIINLSDLTVASGDFTIHEFEVGNRYLTPEQMQARMNLEVDPVPIAGEGQSLKRGWINSQESSSDIGYETYLNVLNDNVDDKQFMYVNNALGGAAIFKANNGSDYYYDEDTDSAGTRLTSMFARWDALEVNPELVSWSQGANDALYLGLVDRPTLAEYKPALLRVFNLIRERYGNVHFFIDIIGRRTSGNNNAGGTQAVREAQLELIEEYSWIHFGAEQWIATLDDEVHPDNAGYIKIATNEAQAIAEYFGSSITNATGPRITNVSRTGTTITVTTNSSTITPATGIEGFVYRDSGDSEISITSATSSGDTITLELASTPVDTNGKLYHVYDRVATENIANMIVDADGKPLRSHVESNI